MLKVAATMWRCSCGVEFTQPHAGSAEDAYADGVRGYKVVQAIVENWA